MHAAGTTLQRKSRTCRRARGQLKGCGGGAADGGGDDGCKSAGLVPRSPRACRLSNTTHSQPLAIVMPLASNLQHKQIKHSLHQCLCVHCAAGMWHGMAACIASQLMVKALSSSCACLTQAPPTLFRRCTSDLTAVCFKSMSWTFAEQVLSQTVSAHLVVPRTSSNRPMKGISLM